MTPNETDTTARRAAIRSLIRTRQVATQEELRELLAEQGFDTTQATLSRDLARLGARRVARPEGGTAYELAEAPAAPTGDRLRELGEMVLEVDHNGTLVALKTEPGAASAVALGIDAARLREVLGTIAGDDCIFVAPARGQAAAKLMKQLKDLFGKG